MTLKLGCAIQDFLACARLEDIAIIIAEGSTIKDMTIKLECTIEEFLALQRNFQIYCSRLHPQLD